MKKYLFVLASLAVSLNAGAANRPGSECGLTDVNGDDSWTDYGVAYGLDNASDAKIHALPSLVKQQLIIAAKNLIDEHVAVEFRDSVEAANELRRGSDGLSVSSFRIGGRKFTQVLHYPGDNPYGVIFKYGTRTVVGFISDSDVFCK